MAAEWPPMTGSDLVTDLEAHLEVFRRGMVDLIDEKQLRGVLEKAISGGKGLRIKFGMDPSSPDLHLGHAIPLFELRSL